VLGARGFFGALAVTHLQAEGIVPQQASRRSGLDLVLDAENADSVRAALRPGDIVLDAAGPFQNRSPTLVEAALEMGFDLVDISDSFSYATSVYALRERIGAAGIRVLTSCSAVSAVSAALMRLSSVSAPVRASVFLAPAAKETANQATALSLVESIGRPVRLRRGGRQATARGWQSSRVFNWPPPAGRVRGYLAESADAFLLPHIWPTLHDVDFWVDSHIPFVDPLLVAGSRLPGFGLLARRVLVVGLPIARKVGSGAGSFGVEVEDATGLVVRSMLWGPRQSYVLAVAPAVLAVRDLRTGRAPEPGLIAADRHVSGADLLAYVSRFGISYSLNS